MLSVELAHDGAPVPGALWSSWHPDPLVLAALLLLGGIYWRGRSRSAAADGRRSWCFAIGLLTVAVAVLSPLDALSSALASAHMVQHLLLTLVAAPLLVLSAPSGALLRGAPAAVRTAVLPVRRVRLVEAVRHALRRPVVGWLLHVSALWLWHAAALYDAALQQPSVHALEHTAFLVTAVLFWRVVIGTRAVRTSPGLAILLVFTMTMQSALLALLLTFAQTPWYAGYTTTTSPWGLEQLADQRLAGAIMWIPAGFVYLAVALALLVSWLRATGAADQPRTDPVPAPPPAMSVG